MRECAPGSPRRVGGASAWARLVRVGVACVMAKKKDKKSEQVRAQPCITNQPILNIMFSHAHLRRAVRRTGASLRGSCTSSCKSRPSRGQRRTWKRREARTQGQQRLNTPPPFIDVHVFPCVICMLGFVVWQVFAKRSRCAHLNHISRSIVSCWLRGLWIS